MVKSMTAYARADKEEDGLSVEVELRSYNGRFLDTHFKVSHGYNRFEEKIRSTIGNTMNMILKSTEGAANAICCVLPYGTLRSY